MRTRPVTPEDAEFLFRVYASTRRDEVAAWGWNAARHTRVRQYRLDPETQPPLARLESEQFRPEGSALAYPAEPLMAENQGISQPNCAPGSVRFATALAWLLRGAAAAA